MYAERASPSTNMVLPLAGHKKPPRPPSSQSAIMFRGRKVTFVQRSHPYSKPEPQQQQPYKAAEEPAVKTREVMRHFFPANKSGGKVISIALDPTTGFEPVVTISKLGSSGVRLDQQAFEELCNNADFLRGYFSSDSPYGQMQMSADITINFTTSYKKPVFVLTQGSQTAHETSVVLAKETWEYMYTLLPMLVHIHKKLAQQTPIVNQYFCDLCKILRSESRQPPGPKEVEEMLFNMRPSDVVQDCLEEQPADPTLLFYELLNFCVYDICSCVNKL